MPKFQYVNDGLVEAAMVVILATDRGLTLGDGAFETMAVRRGVAERLERHLERLENALQVLKFGAHPDTDQIAAAVHELLAANGTETGTLRISVSRGAAARGLAISGAADPTLVMTATDGLPTSDPVSARICASTRRNEHSPLSRIKSLCYLDNILALEEACANGADDAIMLNTKGALAGASAANLFLVRGGRLLTPAVEDGALPGLVREDILAREDAHAETLTEADLHRADEAFLTSSLTIRPLVRVNDRPIGGGSVGPITAKIMKARRT